MSKHNNRFDMTRFEFFLYYCKSLFTRDF